MVIIGNDLEGRFRLSQEEDRCRGQVERVGGQVEVLRSQHGERRPHDFLVDEGRVGPNHRGTLDLVAGPVLSETVAKGPGAITDLPRGFGRD